MGPVNFFRAPSWQASVTRMTICLTHLLVVLHYEWDVSTWEYIYLLRNISVYFATECEENISYQIEGISVVL